MAESHSWMMPVGVLFFDRKNEASVSIEINETAQVRPEIANRCNKLQISKLQFLGRFLT